MSAQHVLENFTRFVGKRLIDCADDIENLAKQHGLLFNARGPDAPRDIDRESNRLNVRLDNDSKILKFTLG